MNDQYRISPYNINSISSIQVMRIIKEKYQLGYYKLIQSQILQTYITRTEWQTVRRINNEILGVKGSSNDRCKRCERLFAKNVSSMFVAGLIAK